MSDLKLEMAIEVEVVDKYGEHFSRVQGTLATFTDVIVVDGRNCGKRVYGDKPGEFYYIELPTI